MKKAKIILSAIGLISVVSAALAFKAQHKFLGRYKCANTPATFCPAIFTIAGTPTTTLFCTLASVDTDCTNKMRVSLNL